MSQQNASTKSILFALLANPGSELVIVLSEETAALLELSFALMAVVLAMVTGNPVIDAIGSIGIGILLIIISIVLAVKVKSLLIGQSTDAETQADINAFIEARPEELNIIIKHE